MPNQDHDEHEVESIGWDAIDEKPDWGLFTYLHGAGRTETHKWLDRHRNDVGRRESARLGERILGDVVKEQPADRHGQGQAGDLMAPEAAGALARRA